MDTAKRTPSAEQNAAGGEVEMGSSGGPPALRTMEFAYQMRDMLTAMLGSLEHLHQQSLDEHGRHQLARAEAAALRATDLLNRYAPLSGLDRQDGYKAEQSRY